MDFPELLEAVANLPGDFWGAVYDLPPPGLHP